MLEDEDSLPCAERELPCDDRYHLARASDRHSQMAGGVVRTFKRVRVGWVVFRRNFIEPCVKVLARAGVCIFVDHEAGAGMPDKDGCRSGGDPAGEDEPLHIFRNLVGSLAACSVGNPSLIASMLKPASDGS